MATCSLDPARVLTFRAARRISPQPRAAGSPEQLSQRLARMLLAGALVAGCGGGAGLDAESAPSADASPSDGGSGPVADASPSDLLLYLRLDEAAGATTFVDSSGTGHPATCSGITCPLVGEPGKSGQAARFDAAENDYLRVTAAGTGLEPSPQISVGAYVRVEATGAQGGEVVSLGDAFVLRVRVDGGLHAHFWDGTTWVVLSASVNARDGQWHHVVAQKTATELELWMDGAKVASQAAAGAIVYAGHGLDDILLGRNGYEEDNVDYSFGGLMDEVRIFGHALTAAEIAAQQQTSGTCGDGTVDPGEACDGDDLNGATCQNQGQGPGTLICNVTCDGFDTTGCSGPSGDYPSTQSGVDVVARATLAMPDYLETVQDPHFEGKIKRITNTDSWRNLYPKAQPWSKRDPATGKHYIMIAYGYRLLDGDTFADLGARNFPGNPQWSNRQHDKMFGTQNGSNALHILNPLTNQTTTRPFPGYVQVSLGYWEGGVSLNDRLALVTLTSSGDYGLLIYDEPTDTVMGEYSWGAIQPNNGQISHTGNYAIVQFNPLGTAMGEGTWLFDANANPIRCLHSHADSGLHHADLARNAAGEDVFVYYRKPSGSNVLSSQRLSDGLIIDLLPGGTAFPNGHISGRAYDRPGWVYLSNHYDSEGLPGWDQLVAVKLDGSYDAQVWCHARTNQTPSGYVYDDSTHAVPNRDGTLIMYGGRWNGASDTATYGYVTGLGL